MTDQSKFIIHIDGACRGNPGQASVGVEIKDSIQKIVKTISWCIGTTTNNVAEYFALICALEDAAILQAKEIEIYTDSQLLARQMSGEYRVKEPLIRLLNRQANRLVQ